MTKLSTSDKAAVAGIVFGTLVMLLVTLAVPVAIVYFLFTH